MIIELPHAEDIADSPAPAEAPPDRPEPIRPGGRSARVRSAVYKATLAILVEEGMSGLTLPAVARRAGVNKKTMYRWWSSPTELTRDALSELEDQAVPTIDTGAWESDVAALVRSFHAYLLDPAATGVMRAIVAMRATDPALGSWVDEFWKSRRELWLAILEQAIARGELEPEARRVPLIELVSGPVLLTHLTTDLRLSDDELDEVAATIAAGVRARYGAANRER